jgi:hypothetical protein
VVSRLYVSHPISSYGTSRESTCLSRLEATLPEVELLNPAQLFSSDGDWLATWPVLLETLSGIVLFPASDLSIGVGCLREVAGGLLHRLPVVAMDGHRSLRHLLGFRLLPERTRCPRRVATLLYGPRLDPEELLERLEPSL